MIKFTIPGAPQGKARARTVYNPRIKRSVSYTPDNTVLYENLIKTRYLEVTDKKYDKFFIAAAVVTMDAVHTFLRALSFFCSALRAAYV